MKMLKLLPAALCVLALGACSDAENEYHSTYFYPLTSEGVVAYADQTEDSTFVVSYDSWTLSADCDWLTVSANGSEAPLTVTIPSGYYAVTKLSLTFQPNTTGSARSYALQAVSSSNKIGSVYQSVIQYPYLDIRYPAVTTTSDGESTTGYVFNMDIPAAGVNSNNANPYINFVVYADDATLESSDTSWLVPAQTTGFTKNELQRIELTATTNNTGASRTATLTLTSNGVSTPITVTQTY